VRRGDAACCGVWLPTFVQPGHRTAGSTALRPALRLLRGLLLPRVMLIGDSISIGYTPFVRKQLCGVVEVHRPPENCGSSGQGVAALNTWFDAAAQGAERWDCVHWNFGIHDIKCPQRDGQNATPLEVYKENLREILRRLRPLAKQIIWCSTTLSPESASGAPPEDFTRYCATMRWRDRSWKRPAACVSTTCGHSRCRGSQRCSCRTTATSRRRGRERSPRRLSLRSNRR
jgi:hypothetical protein